MLITLQRKVRGFSLVELAIVIMIIAIVLGGIWQYANHANENTQREQFAQELSAVVDHVRSYYVGQVGISGLRNTLTYDLARKGIFPPQMVRRGAGSPCTGGNSPCIVDDPWGQYDPAGSKKGALGICGWDTNSPPSPLNCKNNGPAPATPLPTFAVEVDGLQTDSCIGITTQNSGPNGPSGLMDVVINDTSIMSGASTTHSLPIQVNDAITLCKLANPANVDFIYRLRSSAF